MLSGGLIPSQPAPSTSRTASRTAARPVAHVRPAVGSGSRSVSAASNAQLEMLHAQVADLTAAADGFEKERDFYFESKPASHLPRDSPQWLDDSYSE